MGIEPAIRFTETNKTNIPFVLQGGPRMQF